MSKRFSLAAVLAVVIGVAGASLAYAGDSADGESTQTIHLVAKTVQETELDLGKEGFGQGDQFVFADDLFRDGKKVGDDGGFCTAVRVGPGESATFQCVVTLSLEKGQITVQGLFTSAGEADQSPFVVAITGGTGAYRTARGEVKVQTDADEDRLTVKLVS